MGKKMFGVKTDFVFSKLPSEVKDGLALLPISSDQFFREFFSTTTSDPLVSTNLGNRPALNSTKSALSINMKQCPSSFNVPFLFETNLNSLKKGLKKNYKPCRLKGYECCTVMLKKSKKSLKGSKNKNSSSHQNIQPIPNSVRYDDFVGMHDMWLEYFESIFQYNSKRPEISCNCLLKADYHGAKLEVVDSKSDCFIGVEGIVIQETKNCFMLVTRENKVKNIPKKNSVFAFEFKNIIIKIHGSQFCIRPADRFARKVKKSNVTLKAIVNHYK